MAWNVGNKKQVFVDWHLVCPGDGVSSSSGHPASWEMPSGIRLAVHPPRIAPDPLVFSEYPWEAAIYSYSTLLQDEGLFRLYYQCCSVNEEEVLNVDLTQQSPDPHYAMMGYAESTDGLHWVKPMLGLIAFNGSKENNLVFGLDRALGRIADGATVFKDPSAPPDQRYKMVHVGLEGGKPCTFGAVSPDGLHWTALPKPLLTNYQSDTQAVMAFDPDKGRYVGYFRGHTGGYTGGHTWIVQDKGQGRRAIAYAESAVFTDWPWPQVLVTADANDPPYTDVYTNAYTRWPGAADAHLMFPALFQRALDVVEVHVMTSADGVHWERPARSRQPVIAPGLPGSGWEGGVYAGVGLAALQPGEWSLPIGPQWHGHNQAVDPAERLASPLRRGYLCRAVWRQDGFTSLEAETEGRFTTVPLTFSGRCLEVNAWTRFGGEVRVELVDGAGAAVGGHTFADCDPISGDVMRQVVTWQGASDLSAWAGQVIYLRFWLRRSRLHAFQFV